MRGCRTTGSRSRTSSTAARLVPPPKPPLQLLIATTPTPTTPTPTTPTTPTPTSSYYSYLCSLLIYTPSALSCRPPRNRCVFSCKKRLAFILPVNLYTTDDPLAPLAMFSHVKCALYRPPQIPFVFSCKLRLAFTVTVISYDTRPSAPGFGIFFNQNVRRGNPSRFCVFSQVK